ncbi:hypothetical protein LIER_19388 [Lithospermum erythrorhizon]|uniref:Uncharacterized protein n=1 Tax=Lithospermum erythrorhizon TaxID=34254 RepID=A0AAV3QHK7_LITER
MLVHRGRRTQFRRREERKERDFRCGDEDGGYRSDYQRRTMDLGAENNENVRAYGTVMGGDGVHGGGEWSGKQLDKEVGMTVGVGGQDYDNYTKVGVRGNSSEAVENSVRKISGDKTNVMDKLDQGEGIIQAYKGGGKGLHEIQLITEDLIEVEVKCRRLTKRGLTVEKEAPSSRGGDTKLVGEGLEKADSRGKRRKQGGDEGEWSNYIQSGFGSKEFEDEMGGLFHVRIAGKGVPRGVKK